MSNKYYKQEGVTKDTNEMIVIKDGGEDICSGNEVSILICPEQTM